MTTVNGKLIGAANPQRVEMKATLVDVTGAEAVGYVASLDGELVRPVPIQAADTGAWTVTLTANTLITSQSGDTLWAVQEGRAKDGTPRVSYIAVPETGGPYWVGEILADLSSTQTGDSTVVYLAGTPGTDGASAYDVAVANGFVGTETEWLASLVGPQGDSGSGGGAVDSVNGLTGVVVLGAAAVGADPVGAASAAQSAAVSAAATDAAAKMSAHTSATDPHGDRAAAATSLAGHVAAADPHGDRAAAAAALSAHESDTTGVHGITDTAVLETTSGAQAKADAAQTAATTAAASDAAAKVSAHVGATDPHGDRAYADSAKLAKSANLSDLANTGTARGNLGLGGAALLAVGTSAGTVAAGDDARITGALPATGGTISGNLAISGNALGADSPAGHGVAAWCYDPALAVNSTQLTAGTLYLVRVNIAANVTVTKIYWWVANTGSSAAPGQNLVGLYDSAGTLLASANVDASFSTATLKTTTIPSTALSAGAFYWVGMLFNASVTPTLTRASGWTGVDTAANLGLAAAAYRFARNGTGRTALPSPLTPGSNVGTDFAGPWAAVGA